MKFKCIKNDYLERFEIGKIYTIKENFCGYYASENMICISYDTLKNNFIKVGD